MRKGPGGRKLRCEGGSQSPRPTAGSSQTQTCADPHGAPVRKGARRPVGPAGFLDSPRGRRRPPAGAPRRTALPRGVASREAVAEEHLRWRRGRAGDRPQTARQSRSTEQSRGCGGASTRSLTAQRGTGRRAWKGTKSDPQGRGHGDQKRWARRPGRTPPRSVPGPAAEVRGAACARRALWREAGLAAHP